MKLTELNPRWVIEQKEFEPRMGMGISFDCPHCGKQRLGVFFANPIDGHPAALRVEKLWQRDGVKFENLTLTPSVDCSAMGCWHGNITNGEVI